MPPVMGVAAFVMAEFLQVDYGKIALAAAIPAVAFYVALFVIVDLMARKSGIGNLPADEVDRQPLLPRMYLPLLAASALVGAYFLIELPRLTSRVEAVDPVLVVDLAAGGALIVLLLAVSVAVGVKV